MVAGVGASCRDQIQQASLADFLGLADSCSLAQANIADQCPICAGCPPAAVGCGILEATTTQGPTTTIPQGDPCNAVCTLGEQPATCNARIRWILDHVFVGKPNACEQAHDMVLGQCDVCKTCPIGQSECGQDAAPAANDERLFDCNKGATMEWGEAKQAWCCENEQKACDLVGQKKVFFQRKVSNTDAAPAAHSAVPFVAIVGLAAVGTAAAVIYRGAQQQRRQQGLAMHDGLIE